jgi:hypothetical protein
MPDAFESPASLDEIESTSFTLAAINDFEDEIGFDPFELFPDEVDRYRPDLYRLQSEEAGAGETL